MHRIVFVSWPAGRLARAALVVAGLALAVAVVPAGMARAAANSGDGTINEAPLAGGPVTTLVTGQDNRKGWRWTAATSTGPTTASMARSTRPR